MESVALYTDTEMEIVQIKRIIREQVELFCKLGPCCDYNGGQHTHPRLKGETACMQKALDLGDNNPVCNSMTCPLTKEFLEADRK